MNPLYLLRNYAQFSYKLALKIEAEENWQSIVPLPQAKIISFALTSIDLWKQLAEYQSTSRAKVLCTFPVSNSQKNGENFSFPIFHSSSPDQLENFTKSFNLDNLSQTEQPEFCLDDYLISATNLVRQTIFERLLSLDDYSQIPKVNANLEAFNCTLENSASRTKKSSDKALSRFVIAEDYDSVQPSLNETAPFPSPPQNHSDLISGLLRLNFKEISNSISLNFNLSDMYYMTTTSENNLIDEWEQIRSLEDQIELKKQYLEALTEKEQFKKENSCSLSPFNDSSGLNSATDPPASPLFDTEGSSMKFLFGFLEENISKVSIPKLKLRSLMEEIQAEDAIANPGLNCSKSAFYEALERMIQELVMMKDHSYPFLYPVLRKTAPDYHKKITNPMDFSTISKRIKNNKYPSKKEFAADVALIYSNCRAYNTTRGNELIQHAKIMEERTKILLKAIPETYSKNLPDTPSQDHSLTPSKISAHLIEASSSPMGKRHDLNLDSSLLSSQSQPHKNLNNLDSESTLLEISKTQEELLSLQQLVDKACSKSKTILNPKEQYWVDATKEVRATNQLLNTPLNFTQFDNCPAIGPTFDPELHMPSYPAKPFLTSDFNLINDSTKRHRLSKQTILDCFPELSISGAVPNISLWPGTDDGNYFDREPGNGVSLSKFNALRIASKSLPLNFLRNSLELKAAKEMADKITIAKDFLEESTNLKEGDELKATIQFLSSTTKTSIESYAPLLTHQSLLVENPNLDRETAYVTMRKYSVLILQHAGFDSADDQALEIFTDILTGHLKTLGQTMRVYLDNHSHSMSSEEILLHTLYETNVEGPSHLMDYVTTDIEHYGNRLVDIHTKMRERFDEILSSSKDAGGQYENDIDIAEGAYGCLTGNFDDVTGDDFFGLKELGLDKELGLESLTVPVRLLLGHKKKTMASPTVGNEAEQSLEFTPPPNFSPVTSADQSIGLLREFFDDLFKESGNMPIEDEFDPPRKTLKPKVPPVGKQILVQRRRQAEHAIQSAAKRQKKALENEEKKNAKLKKQQEKEQRAKDRKAASAAKTQVRLAAREAKRKAREEQAQLRKEATELKQALRGNNNPVTPTTATPEEESPRLSTSPATSSFGSSSSLTSSTTSDDDSSGPIPQSKPHFARKQLPMTRRDLNYPAPRPSGSKCPPQINGVDRYSVLSSTSEDDFSGSVSLSEDDDVKAQPSYRHVPSRWSLATSSNSRTNGTSTLPSINKPRKKPFRSTNNLASPATRHIKRKGPQK